MLHEINERIDVIALFEQGQITPCRIRWRDKVYKIEQTYSTWQHRQGQMRELHLTVGTDAKFTMELVLTIDGCHLSWQLKRIQWDGTK